MNDVIENRILLNQIKIMSLLTDENLTSNERNEIMKKAIRDSCAALSSESVRHCCCEGIAKTAQKLWL